MLPSASCLKASAMLYADKAFLWRSKHSRTRLRFEVKRVPLSIQRRSARSNICWIFIQKLPKNSSPVRAHNRCKLTGRPKGYMRQFGISRVLFREMANKGLIPGVRKASW